MSSRQYELFRYRNQDGSSKDWAVCANSDGSYTSRWGKTGTRLQSKTFKNMMPMQEHIQSKIRKGYKSLGFFFIDDDGKLTTVPPQLDPVEPDFPSENPQIYWTIRFINNLPSENHDSFKELSVRLKGIFVRLGKDFDVEPIRKSPLIRNSGIVNKEDGVFVFLFLLALKKFSPVGVTVSLSHEDGIEISDQLKLETEALSFFNTDLESIRSIAEEIGLLQKRLDISTIAPEIEDFYF